MVHIPLITKLDKSVRIKLQSIVSVEDLWGILLTEQCLKGFLGGFSAAVPGKALNEGKFLKVVSDKVFLVHDVKEISADCVPCPRQDVQLHQGFLALRGSFLLANWAFCSTLYNVIIDAIPKYYRV